MKFNERNKSILLQMLNIKNYSKSIINRYLSINKSSLIESSRNIQAILKHSDDKLILSKYFFNCLNEIHDEYRSNNIASSTKEIYQKDSSKLNLKYIQLENDRKNQIGEFNEKNFNQLIIHLRYIRYLNVCFIYRLITFDIDITLKESSNLIIRLTNKNQNNFQPKFV